MTKWMVFQKNYIQILWLNKIKEPKYILLIIYPSIKAKKRIQKNQSSANKIIIIFMNKNVLRIKFWDLLFKIDFQII